MENAIIAAAEAAYIQIMGRARWDSLTAEQRHDVIMLLVKDMLRALS